MQIRAVLHTAEAARGIHNFFSYHNLGKFCTKLSSYY